MRISINKDNLIYPYFVLEGRDKKEEIKSFLGIYRFSPDKLLQDIKEIKQLGLNKILLFGVGAKKDHLGSAAYATDSIVVKTVAKIKAEFPDLVVLTDVCLCAYTSHGHCGVLRSSGKVSIDNKRTLQSLAQMALVHAQAGADWVAPSAMAKHQVWAIREALNKNGFKKTKILGYSAKFASNFYGPFRNAANSSPSFGDRSGYQLDYKNTEKALEEINADIREGADMVMVKPAISYLDVISQVKKFGWASAPLLAAYNVSGEYAFVKYGAKNRLWDERKMVFELITSIKRAGADFIITYHAKDIAKWLKKEV